MHRPGRPRWSFPSPGYAKTLAGSREVRAACFLPPPPQKLRQSPTTACLLKPRLEFACATTDRHRSCGVGDAFEKRMGSNRDAAKAQINRKGHAGQRIMQKGGARLQELFRRLGEQDVASPGRCAPDPSWAEAGFRMTTLTEYNTLRIYTGGTPVLHPQSIQQVGLFADDTGP
jgi:hypothetical protein